MAARKTPSRQAKSPKKSTAAAADKTEPRDPGERYTGQWNRLVSTTNWEKGRIICEWRDALATSGTKPAAYSDDAWAELVGGVTAQHVGRLRRIFQRFGETFDQYEGLYWSHFHAGLDWDDAEMWLEGAIQNDWSVSQMRGKRWETLGKPGKAPAMDDAAAASGATEVDDVPAAADGGRNQAAPPAAKAASSSAASIAEKTPASGGSAKTESHDFDEPSATTPASKAGKRVKVAVDELPDDVAEAFEQFKLVIIAHRRDGWRETTAEAVIECLDALRELALAEG